jgi:hypothetical protein
LPPPCRRAFETAGRRFVAEAIASGTLTVDALKKCSAATPALLPLAMPLTPVPEEPQKSAAIARAAGEEERAAIVEYEACCGGDDYRLVAVSDH